MKKHRLVLMKELFFTIIIIFCVMHLALVSGNQVKSINEVTADADITPFEVEMSINCTWDEAQWANESTLPPLSGSGWAPDIISISVSHTQTVELYVTDFQQKGDYYEVYEVDGVPPTTAELIGVTPIVPVSFDYEGDPQTAFNDPGYSSSKFTLVLSPGTHYFAFREVGHYHYGGNLSVKFCQGPSPVGGKLVPGNSISLYVASLVFLCYFGILLKKNTSLKII